MSAAKDGDGKAKDKAKDKKEKPKKAAAGDDDIGGDDDGGDGKTPEGFNAWPSIVLLSNVATTFRKCAAAKAEGKGFAPYNDWCGKTITYKSKVKLHGQNGGVNLSLAADGSVVMAVQSRSQFIAANNKLGKVIGDATAYWQSLFDKTAGYKRLTVFGEFAGPGVQKGVALAKIPSLIFAVFGAEIDGQIVFDPTQLTALLTKKGTVQLPKHTYVLPWYPATAADGTSYPLNFTDEKAMESPLNEINASVSAIDSNDPWVEAVFNVKGNGEGLVFYPTTMADAKTGYLTKEAFETFAFKAKGEKHRTVATEKAVSTKAPAAAGVDAFVRMVTTDARMEQGVQSVGGYDKSKTGAFVKWLVADVQKECKAELEASKLQWKEVQGAVTKAAQSWWLAKGGGGGGAKKDDGKAAAK